MLANIYWKAIENTSKINCNNSNNLRKLLDTFSENLSALKNLAFDINPFTDFILSSMLLKRIDPEISKAFELTHNSLEIPEYKKVYDF